MTSRRGSMPLPVGAALALLIAALALGLLAPVRAAAVPDPVIPFPVTAYTCDQTPPAWPVDPQFPDAWCGAWKAGETRPEVADPTPVAALGRVTLYRISEEDASRLLFFHTAQTPAFPLIPHLVEPGFARLSCNDMLADRVPTGRYYLGTFVNGDERGYIGACTNLANFPDVLNGGYVSQYSADPALPPTARILRQGAFSLRISADGLSAEGEMAPDWGPGNFPAPASKWWLFTATREGAAPQGFLSPGVRDGVAGNTAFTASGMVVACAVAAKVVGVAVLTNPAGWTALPISGQIVVAACIGSAVATAGGAALLTIDALIHKWRASHEVVRAPAPAHGHAASAGTVLLPLPRPVNGEGLAAGCRAGPGGRACRRLAGVAGRYLTAVGTVASAQQAATAAEGRYGAALSAGDAAGQTLQSGVTKIYLGLLATTITEQHRAARALAAGLRRERLDIRLSGAQTSRVAARLGGAGGLPAPARSWLRRGGMSAAAAADAVRQGSALARVAGRPLTLRGVLTAAPAPTAGLAKAYRSITTDEVREIVRALARQRALSGTLAARLQADLTGLEGASGATARASGVRTLRADAARAGGRYGILLQLAVRPLS